MNHGIDAYELALLEQEFIRATFSGKKDEFEKAAGYLSGSTNLRPILQGVIASAIWALLGSAGGHP